MLIWDHTDWHICLDIPPTSWWVSSVTVVMVSPASFTTQPITSPPTHPSIWVKYLDYIVRLSRLSCWLRKIEEKENNIATFSPFSFVRIYIYNFPSKYVAALTGGKSEEESCVCSLIRLDHLFLLQFHYYVHAWLSFSAPGTDWDCSAPRRCVATFLPPSGPVQPPGKSS